jgi:hypothetical protein
MILKCKIICEFIFEIFLQHKGSFSFNDYYPVEAMHEYFDYLEAKYAAVVDSVVIGTSFEGRPQRLLRICKNGECGKR